MDIKNNNQKEAEEKCKKFIINSKEALITIYKNENDDQGILVRVPFIAHNVSFPRVQIILSNDMYEFLCKTKRYRIAISAGSDHRAYSMSDVILSSVPASVDTS